MTPWLISLSFLAGAPVAHPATGATLQTVPIGVIADGPLNGPTAFSQVLRTELEAVFGGDYRMAVPEDAVFVGDHSPSGLESATVRLASRSDLDVIFALVVATIAAPVPSLAQIIGEDGWTPIPFRVRDLTFPTVLVMQFQPAPVGGLSRGSWVFELNYSASNNFQMSENIRHHLEASDRQPAPLSAADAEDILRNVDGDRFLIDGEFGLFDAGMHYGLTDNVSLSARISYLTYGGGYLDGAIWDFHETFGYGQMGRQYVADDGFQMLLVTNDESLVLLDRPTSGGFTDPVVGLRWRLPNRLGEWSFGLELGVKIPMADTDRLLSTGRLDAGVQLTAQRRWERNAVVLNMAYVAPGDFEPSHSFEPPDLPSLDIAWIHRIGRHATANLQLLFSDNIFSDATDSDLAELEFQITGGVKWPALGGLVGIGLTENLLNYNNTPDVAVHLSYGVLLN